MFEPLQRMLEIQSEFYYYCYWTSSYFPHPVLVNGEQC